MLEGFFLVVGVVVGLYVALWIFILLPMDMARVRGRSALFWVLASLVISPFFACPLLWLLGAAPSCRVDPEM